MSTLCTSRRRFASRKGFNPKGFTLIEILVVLSIAAIVTAITVGGFKEMTAGNKRVSCQSNLAQIYQACRLYAADEGGKFPYYASTASDKVADCAAPSNNVGIGLWSLYTFPNASYNAPAAVDSAPIERYIRSIKVLHCPEDFDLTHAGIYDAATPTKYNDRYLSYQSCDDGTKAPGNPPNAGIPTYSSTRTTNSADPYWKRQLMNFNSGGNFISRPPDDKTIVTWCPWHRNSRNLDNVLFYDGSVQLIANQSASTNWQRDPKAPQ